MTIGNRLKSERERLGLSQPSFGKAAGVVKQTVIQWEKGVSSPTTVQLSALAEVGVDVFYVLGQHDVPFEQPSQVNQDLACYEATGSQSLRAFVTQIGEWVASGQLKDEDIDVLAGMAARLAGPEPAVAPPPLPRARPVVPERPPMPRNAQVYQPGEKAAVVRKTKKVQK